MIDDKKYNSSPYYNNLFSESIYREILISSNHSYEMIRYDRNNHSHGILWYTFNLLEFEIS